MQVRSLVREDHLEEGMATHSSIPAWRLPRTEQPGGLQHMGLQRVGYNWSDFANTCTHAHTHTHIMSENNHKEITTKIVVILGWG